MKQNLIREHKCLICGEIVTTNWHYSSVHKIIVSWGIRQRSGEYFCPACRIKMSVDKFALHLFESHKSEALHKRVSERIVKVSTHVGVPPSTYMQAGVPSSKDLSRILTPELFNWMAEQIVALKATNKQLSEDLRKIIAEKDRWVARMESQQKAALSETFWTVHEDLKKGH